MKKALIVGIDHYDNALQNLDGSVKSSKNIATLFARNYDGNDAVSEPNFNCKLLVSSTQKEKKITRRILKENIKNLFEDEESDIALLYYSGYGFENSLGGYLATQDSEEHDEGVAFNDVMIYANNSNIKEIIIILDFFYIKPQDKFNIGFTEAALLRKGVSILTSCTVLKTNETNMEESCFSKSIQSTLKGGHTDIFGHIRITDLYEQAERILTPLGQETMFKTNSTRLSALRKIIPQVPYGILKKMIVHFHGPNYRFPLDPEHVPSQGLEIVEKQKVYNELQKMAKNGLVEPVNEMHMYYAGVNSTYCKLTERGKQYWELFKKNRI